MTQPNQQDIEKECKNCYGKGYSTELQGKTIGSPDFKGDKGFELPEKFIIHYCDCDRGKQLKRIISAQKENWVKEMIEKIKSLKENYSGGLERFEQDNDVDLEKLVFAYNKAIDETIQLLTNQL